MATRKKTKKKKVTPPTRRGRLDPETIERVAREAALSFQSSDWHYTFIEEHPHIAPFKYEIWALIPDDEDFEREKVGFVSGYVIGQDWSVHEANLWDEADALDGDVSAYVDSLIRELRAFNELAHSGVDLTSMQRVLIIKHVETNDGVDAVALMKNVVATLCMKETARMVLVDPWPYSEERAQATGKLEGRKRTASLLTLGFVRMVGSRFIWGWDVENADCLMHDYSYEKLLAAKRAGKLEKVLKQSAAEDVYGPDIARVLDKANLPNPDRLMEE